MEEDEEVILERSPFYHHLRDAGFSEIETKSSAGVLPVETTIRKKESIDCNVVEEVITLRAANLIFEDDLEHVDCIFANFELNKNEPLKYMFRGTTSAIVLALGLCFYVYIGSYAFALVSVFYAYRASDYLWQKRRRLKQLKRLMGVIQSNFSLLNKVLKFLYEHENMLKARIGCKTSQRAIDSVLYLKADFACLQKDINSIFADATDLLLKDVPLWNYVETPSSYICHRMDDYRNCKSVSQLHNMLMLLQSQFLTRLIFSLVPNLVEKPEDSFAIINKVIVRVTARLRDIHTALNKKFRFSLINGICFERGRSIRPLPQKTRSKDMSRETLTTNVHDLSNSLQYLLIKSREVENILESGGMAETEQELSSIQSELASCHSHIADLLLLQKKYNPGQSTNHKTNEGSHTEILNSEPVVSTEIGYSDLDPQVDDDIFEAVTGNQPEVNESQDWAREEFDPLAKKKRKEMLGELKTRLKAQAEDWARRELTILARKGLPLTQYDTDEQMEKVRESSSDDEHECELPKRRNVYCQRYGDSSSEDDLPEIPISPIDAVLFGESLLQARSKFLSSNLGEENFCGSGENSDIES